MPRTIIFQAPSCTKLRLTDAPSHGLGTAGVIGVSRNARAGRRDACRSLRGARGAPLLSEVPPQQSLAHETRSVAGVSDLLVSLYEEHQRRDSGSSLESRIVRVRGAQQWARRADASRHRTRRTLPQWRRRSGYDDPKVVTFPCLDSRGSI